MKKTATTLFTMLLLLGCSSTKYGYSLEEWDRMTQAERDQAITQAESMMVEVQKKQREKEFLYQSVDIIFGSRSNVYGDRRNPY